MQMINLLVKTQRRNKRDMQFLTSAQNFRCVSWPPPPWHG